MKDNNKMELWEHLEELRWVIFKLMVLLLVTTILSAFFIDDILKIIMLPIEELAKTHPNYTIEQIMTSPFDGIMIKMKVAFLGGFILGFPFILYLLWSFIAPALKEVESKAFIWICSFGTISFLIGVVFGYMLINPTLQILLQMGIQSAKNYWTIKEFVSFVFYWLLGAGFIFELPMLLLILTKLNIIDVLFLKKIRPYFIVIAFAFSAIVTPADPFTMLMVGIPIIALYELGIIIASFHKNI